jgi:hypothetical protein
MVAAYEALFERIVVHRGHVPVMASNDVRSLDAHVDGMRAK